MSPIRTCMGCGGRSPQEALTRFVARDGALQLDPARRLPGRGAYLHRAAACVEGFVARRGPVRSLRCTPTRAARQALAASLAGVVARG